MTWNRSARTAITTSSASFCGAFQVHDAGIIVLCPSKTKKADNNKDATLPPCYRRCCHLYRHRYCYPAVLLTPLQPPLLLPLLPSCRCCYRLCYRLYCRRYYLYRRRCGYRLRVAFTRWSAICSQQYISAVLGTSYNASKHAFHALHLSSSWEFFNARPGFPYGPVELPAIDMAPNRPDK
jgi:hypothetical protein